MLAPGAEGQPVQLIDARDLASIILLMSRAAADGAGTFNATVPPSG